MIELPVIESFDANEDTPRSRYWRSVSQFENSDEFKRVSGEEFIPGASNAPEGATRRQFIQLMGASMAMAGLTACRKPLETIVPFSHMPEDRVEGTPVYYASSMPFRGSLHPVLVESFDGRPRKVEGNPEHPDSLGTTGQYQQASILNLYDPDRSTQVIHNGATSSWALFKSFAASLPSSSRIAVLSSPSSSMTFAAIRKQFEQRFNSVQWVDCSVGGNNATRGLNAAFGRGVRATHNLAQAKVIVSLDSDFLGSVDQDSVSNARGFSASRNVEDSSEMSRLYVIESGYSITGGMADNRLRMKSAEVASFAAALGSALGAYSGDTGTHASHPWVNEVASDLRRAGSAGVVLVGDHQPAGVHALAAAINSAIGAAGSTVNYVDANDNASDVHEDLASVASAIDAGNVDVIVTLGLNPVYSHPSFAASYSKIAERIHLGLHQDETAQQATWSLPQTHFLEEWGDGTSRSGMHGIVQPLIAPLYEDAHSALEVVALLATGSEQFGYDLVRTTWRTLLSGDFEKSWRKVVHDGFHEGSRFAPVAASPSTSGVASAMMGVSVAAHSGVEVVSRLDSKVLDGSFANNVWMQELPDPTTKVVWDNVAQMNPKTAEKLGVGYKLDGGKYITDIVKLVVGSESVELPVWVQPGLADDSVQISKGYGRSILSEREITSTNFFDLDDYTDVYGKGAVSTGVGTSINAIEEAIATATASKAGAGFMVASTQDHGAIQEEGEIVKKRGLFRQATVSEYRANPNFVAGSEPAPIREDWSGYPTLWQDNHPSNKEEVTKSNYHDYQWGMVIDLNTCTGCSACVVACQSENNIQVVGKQEVSRGREMHWIRTDRYFVSGDGATFDDPQMVLQPLPCQHCENAPCEQVCPVAATVHSPDGTNQMIYNRCIGTRYCANNCPYKVRRFNFFNWIKTVPKTVQMSHNPNVTVRSRGVMEKCSFCIQRVRQVNKTANIENRSIEDGEVVTACQQVCPSRAISFGNVADPNSAVSQKRTSDRRYELLAELAVKPRVSYLGRVRNPNPNLA